MQACAVQGAGGEPWRLQQPCLTTVVLPVAPGPHTRHGEAWPALHPNTSASWSTSVSRPEKRCLTALAAIAGAAAVVQLPPPGTGSAGNCGQRAAMPEVLDVSLCKHERSAKDGVRQRGRVDSRAGRATKRAND